MSIQSDLDLAMAQLEEMTPAMLTLYAYAAIKLLEEKKPDAVKNGSFDVFISDVPVYDRTIEHEVPMNLNATISVAETLVGLDY